MERKDVKWDAIRLKEREILNLEEQYYQQKKKLEKKTLELEERSARLEKIMDEEADKMYLVLRKFSSPADCVRDYFTEIENLRYHSNQVYRTKGIKLEEEKEKLDKEFRQRKNILKDNFNKESKKIASETKSSITSINSQMDTAIQGKVRKSLEEKIPNMLLKYDEI